MKILLIHTYYTLRGGEDAVFEQESALLGDRNEVKVLTFRNRGGLIGAFQFLLSVWNIFSSIKVRNCIKEFGPDVVHIHNWHFATGPLIIRTIKKEKIPILLTLHNYRLLCPSATLLYNGQIFKDSLNRAFPWKAVKYKLYRNSALQTFWLGFIIWFHKLIGTWNMVDKYITLTEFAKQLFKDNLTDVANEKFVVKPNFVPENFEIGIRGKHFLFVGRLSEEKGLKILLDVFKNAKAKLTIVGTGSLKSEVEKVALEYSNIDYLGNLTAVDVKREMSICSVLIFPSIWYEGMPMTIIEAFSTGTPVIASNLGSMATMIVNGYNGLLFEPGSSDDLGAKLNFWDNIDESLKLEYQKNAKDTYSKYYCPQQNMEQLMNIYNKI